MAASTNKKIVLLRFDREALSGFVNPQNYLQDNGLEMLSLAGTLTLVPWEDVKAVYFVRDFGPVDLPSDKRVFNARPKMNGIWVRMRFRDGDVMDGMMPNNLLQIESRGFTFAPPSPSANHQKLFVPRTALLEAQILGVVGSPLHLHKAKPKPKEQIELFE